MFEACTLGTVSQFFSVILSTLARKINYNLFEFTFLILFGASTLLIAIKYLLFMIYRCFANSGRNYLHMTIDILLLCLTFSTFGQFSYIPTFNCCPRFCFNDSFKRNVSVNVVQLNGKQYRHYNIVRQKGNHFLINIPLT